MRVAILAEARQKEEILAKPVNDNIEFLWPDSVSSLLMLEADFYFDLKFEPDPPRTARLKKLFPAPVVIGAVNQTLSQIGATRFIRLNNWPGMMGRPIMELAFAESQRAQVERLSEATGWKFLQAPDVIGMITPRIIASIINEAYFALGEQISTKDSIDLAMRTGTNYPYGPFEWEAIIGATNILDLLQSLHDNNKRYEIAPLLTRQSG